MCLGSHQMVSAHYLSCLGTTEGWLRPFHPPRTCDRRNRRRRHEISFFYFLRSTPLGFFARTEVLWEGQCLSHKQASPPSRPPSSPDLPPQTHTHAPSSAGTAPGSGTSPCGGGTSVGTYRQALCRRRFPWCCVPSRRRPAAWPKGRHSSSGACCRRRRGSRHPRNAQRCGTCRRGCLYEYTNSNGVAASQRGCATAAVGGGWGRSGRGLRSVAWRSRHECPWESGEDLHRRVAPGQQFCRAVRPGGEILAGRRL